MLDDGYSVRLGRGQSRTITGREPVSAVGDVPLVVGYRERNRLLRSKFRAVASLRTVPAIGYVALMLGAIQVGLRQQGKLAGLPAVGADHEAITEFGRSGRSEEHTS